MSPLVISYICAGAMIILEALVIAYLISQKKLQEDASDELVQQIAGLKEQNTKWKKVNHEANMEADWFRCLFENTKDIVFVHSITEYDLPGPLLEVNAAACVALGHPRDQLLKMTPMDLEPSDLPVATSGYSRSDLAVLSDTYIQQRERKIAARAARQLMKQTLENGHLLFEKVYVDGNGRRFPVEVHARVFEMQEEKLIICTAEEISERKKTAQALNESRQRFQDFFARSPIGIAMYDAQRNLIDANLACLKIFGSPGRDEFMRYRMFDNRFMPETIKKKIQKGESVRYESIIDFDEVLKDLMFVTKRTGIAHLDIMINNMGPDANFRPRGYFAQVQDVTEIREAEEDLRKSEIQLRQAEKMEAIGSMAGGIAHDFNNILTPILGYAKMLLRITQKEETAHEYGQKIEKAGNRAKELVAQILTFARKTEGQDDKNYKPVHVIPIAKEVLQMKRTAIPDNVEIKRIIKTDKDVVIADPTKLHSVLMNLCTNAGHAMIPTDGGVLEMLITDFVIDQKAKSDLEGLEPGRYLRISVRDTGTGMDQATLSRIFEPFFTTKKSGEGTGMGLSVVVGIVKSFKGTITVDTEPGKGSTFHVILPVVEKAAEDEIDAADIVIPSGNECILTVDDDPEILELEGHMLASLGYKPVAAANAQEALDLFKQSPYQFDLLLTDQVMPGMSGAELTQQVLAIRGDLPVVMCTAYSENISQEEAKGLGVKEFLEKPLALEELGEALRRALDRKQA